MPASAVVPAHNNEKSIAETVRALIGDPRLGEVIVVDDASADATAARAASAGARVIRLPRNLGKGPALERGLEEAVGEVLLMVDGDTGQSASGAISLLDKVLSGEVDMVIGVLPAAGKRGGFGTVKKLTARLIAKTSGFESRAPLSGQRAFRRSLFEACRPLAGGFAVDAALTADAVRKGFRVIEVPVDMTHDHRGRSIGGFAHRARQGADVLRAFLPRLLRK